MAPVTDVEGHLKLLAGPDAERRATPRGTSPEARGSHRGRCRPRPAASHRRRSPSSQRNHGELLVDFRIEVTRRGPRGDGSGAWRPPAGARRDVRCRARADGRPSSPPRWSGARWPRHRVAVLSPSSARSIGPRRTPSRQADLLTQATAATGLVAAAWGVVDAGDAAPVTSDAVAYAAVAARELGR